MKSRTPKVLHTLCGRSMLGHVLAVAEDLHPDRLIVVVGQVHLVPSRVGQVAVSHLD